MLRSESKCSFFTPNLTTAPTRFGRCLILPIIHRIHHLTSGDVPDQLRERDRITGAGETLGCHEPEYNTPAK